MKKILFVLLLLFPIFVFGQYTEIECFATYDYDPKTSILNNDDQWFFEISPNFKIENGFVQRARYSNPNFTFQDTDRDYDKVLEKQDIRGNRYLMNYSPNCIYKGTTVIESYSNPHYQKLESLYHCILLDITGFYGKRLVVFLRTIFDMDTIIYKSEDGGGLRKQYLSFITNISMLFEFDLVCALNKDDLKNGKGVLVKTFNKGNIPEPNPISKDSPDSRKYYLNTTHTIDYYTNYSVSFDELSLAFKNSQYGEDAIYVDNPEDRLYFTFRYKAPDNSNINVTKTYYTETICSCPKFLHPCHVPDEDLITDENGTPDNKFGIDKTTTKVVSINPLTGEAYNYSDDFGEGSFNMVQFSNRDNISEVTTKLYAIPTITYNYVNNSDYYNFWYSGDKQNALTLSFEYTENTLIDTILSKNFKVFDQNDNELELIEYNSKKIGDVMLFNGAESNNKETIPKIRTSFLVKCNNDKITSLHFKFNDSRFIDTHKDGIELHSYPMINTTISDASVYNPTCYYDNAYIYIDNVVGGLLKNHNEDNDKEKDFKYIVEEESTGKKIEFTNSSTLVITKDDFGLGNHNLNLIIYDLEKPDGDSGYENRKNSLNFNVNFPERLLITDYSASNLLCHNDSTGKIEITNWLNKNNELSKNYKFQITQKLSEVDDFELISETTLAEKLVAGYYRLNIYNSENGCHNDSLYLTITQPDTIAIDKKSIIINSPQCFGYNNGSISYLVSGGTGEYIFMWNDNSDINIQNLDTASVGNYQVKITDENQCFITQDFEVTQPEKLTNIVAGDYTICQNGQKILQSNEFNNYSWCQNDVEFSNQPLVTISKAGQYTLKATDGDDCYVIDTVNIFVSEVAFNKSLLVASESYLGDTIVLVNNYKIDDNVFTFTFDVDENFIVLGSDNDYFYRIIAPVEWGAGVYSIFMHATGPEGCIVDEKREITILGGFRPENYEQSIIENTDNFVDIKMGPNPSDGNFNLDIVLSEDADLEMRLYSISNPKLLKTEKYHGDNKYYISCNDGLNPGQYLLMLKSKGQTKVMKFMVTK